MVQVIIVTEAWYIFKISTQDLLLLVLLKRIQMILVLIRQISKLFLFFFFQLVNIDRF